MLMLFALLIAMRGAGGLRAHHRRAARHAAAHRLPLLLERGEPGERADQGSQHAGLAVQHRGDRLRAVRDLHRHRSRLGDARGGRAPRAHHAADVLERPAGHRATRHDRLQGALLPLPRHEHGARARGTRELSTIDTALLLRRHPRREAVLHHRATRRRSRSARSPTRSTTASTGTSCATSAPGIRMGWKPETGFAGFGDVDRLQRGDDPLHPRARLADASRCPRAPGPPGPAATTGGPSTATPT